MGINELNKRKIPPSKTAVQLIVKIDKSLEKFKGKILFPEKLKLANEILKKVGVLKPESK